MNTNTKERGQVLVLIILAIAVIFGFAALAIDVGRLYSERRRAQSAADAAAYAAAFAASQGDAKAVYLQKGLDSADRNGFFDDNAAAELGERVDVEVYNPPISGKYSVASGTVNPNEYYQVFITQEVDPVFSQFVYQGSWMVKVEAVVHSTAKKSFADGNVIVATCDDCCDAIEFSGNPYIYINGGDITSNSTGGTKSNCTSGENNGTGCIIIEDGGINLNEDWNPESVSSCKDQYGNTISPPVQVENGINEDSDDLWSNIDPGMPGCLDPTTGNSLPSTNTYKYNNVGTEPGKPYILEPGIYKQGISISGQNSVVQLKPGMYCLDGDLNVSAGSLTGNGVMFVMRKNSSIRITTGQTVILTAPGKEPDQVGGCIRDPKFYDTDENFCWSGFLVYMPYSNAGEVHLGGGNSTQYTGTIFAPGPRNPESQDKCTLTGNSETMGVKASIICYNVNVGGTGSINIEYYDELNAQQPAMIDLAK